MPERKERRPEIMTQNIGDADLAYLLYEGDGPPMILMHATGFNPWVWHPIARDLGSSWRVIAPYVCDHRTVDPEAGGVSWLTLAEDVAAFCRVKRIEKPALVGHSMGGTVLTLALGVCGLKCRGLILIEPIFFPKEMYRREGAWGKNPLAVRALKRKETWNNRKEALSYLRSRPLFRKWDPEMLDLYIHYGIEEAGNGGVRLVCPPKRESALYMGNQRFDPWPVLDHVTCPTLVIEGELSDYKKFIDMKKAAAAFPRGSYRMIKGVGHFIPMEKPREVAAIIKDFFGDPGKPVG
jgi:lipase